MKHRILTIVGIIGVFSLGSLGAIWAQAFLMPFFSSHSSFQEWGFVRDWNNRTTVVREVREVVIRTDEQVQRVAARAEGMVVGLESRSGSLIIGGSGFVVTSDGFLLTLASQVPQGYKVWVYLKEGVDPVLGEVLKRDIQKNLAIVKIDKRDLQTTGFALDDSVGAGAPVVLVAKSVEAGSLVTIVNQGRIPNPNKDFFLITKLGLRSLIKE